MQGAHASTPLSPAPRGITLSEVEGSIGYRSRQGPYMGMRLFQHPVSKTQLTRCFKGLFAPGKANFHSVPMNSFHTLLYKTDRLRTSACSLSLENYMHIPLGPS